MVIEHLRISTLSNKLLKGVMLTELSSLNLLAGKNGAGKSTVLKALAKQALENSSYKEIYSPGSRELSLLNWIGRIFDEHESEKIWSEIAELSLSDDPQVKKGLPRDDEFVNELKELFKQSVSASNKPQFMPEALREFDKNSQAIYDTSWISGTKSRLQEVHAVQSHLEAFFRQSFSCVLIPPRRELICDAKNGTPFELLPSGAGLVNRLFELKSSSRNTEAWRRYQGLLRDFQDISGGVKFEVVLHADQTLHIEFGFGKSPSWINSAMTGTGFANVLILLYWISEPDIDLVLVEEPENHLHPLLLNNFAKYVSDLTDRVVIMATHSSHLISAPVKKRIFWTEYLDKKDQSCIMVTDQTKASAVVAELGTSVTEYLGASILVLTEGHSDRIAIRVFLQQLNVAPLNEICFVSLGGDAMTHFEIEPLKSKFQIFALIDKDPKSKKARDIFTANCFSSGVTCYQLEHYALENYFSIEAYKTVFPLESLPDAVPLNEKVEDIFMFSPKGNIEELARNTPVQNVLDSEFGKFLIDLKKSVAPKLGEFEAP